MTGFFLGLSALGVVLASAAMTCLWAIQALTRDASHVDVGWATGIAVLTVDQRTTSVFVPRPPRTDAHDDSLDRRVPW